MKRIIRTLMNNSQTDLERLRLTKDEDIDFSDLPPITEEMFRRAFRFNREEPIPTASQTAVPIFNDVVEFFRKRHRLYPFEIDKVLREFMAEEEAKENLK